MAASAEWNAPGYALLGANLASLPTSFHFASWLRIGADLGLKLGHDTQVRVDVRQDDQAAFETKMEAFRKELGYWEKYLSSSKYVAGNEFTLADFAFACQCLFFVRQGASFDSFPKLKSYLEQAKVSIFPRAMHLLQFCCQFIVCSFPQRRSCACCIASCSLLEACRAWDWVSMVVSQLKPHSSGHIQY